MDKRRGNAYAGVAVEGKVVLGARGNTGDLALGGGALNVSAESSRGLGTLKSQVVGTETSDVGSGHGGTRDGVGGRVGADPRGQNVGAGGEDVDEGTEVGVRGKSISRGGGTDSAGGGLRGGRVAGGVGTVVSGGDGQEDTGADHVGGGSVDGSGLGATERHVGDGTVGAAAGLGVGGDVVHARDDTRVGSGAGGVENLDSVQADLLGDTVGGTSDGSSDVGTA